jgi:glycosyltransferase involved in cell wall biosynthesis
MSRVRILVASGIFPPDPGGPATHLAQLIPTLLSRGHAVRALAFGAAGRAGYPQSVDALRIPLDQPLAVRILRYASEYRRRAAWADIVYVATSGLPRPPQSRPVVLRVPGDRAWERAVNRRLVAQSEDIDAFQRSRGGLRVEAMKWARGREARSADRVLVPSEYLRAMVLGWGVDRSRVRVVPSAMNDGHAAMTQLQARTALGWNPGGRYILTAARLTPWKGVDHLIDAVARVPNATLIVAGDGPEKASLMARAARSAAAVSFVGMLPRDELAVYTRAADYVALYSGYEGLSHVLLESLRLGTPVIASDRGGNPEIVRDGCNGLLVRHPDVEALVAAMRTAFDGSMRDRLAAGAPKSVGRFVDGAVMPIVAAEIESAAVRAVGSRCAC